MEASSWFCFGTPEINDTSNVYVQRTCNITLMSKRFLCAFLRVIYVVPFVFVVEVCELGGGICMDGTKDEFGRICEGKVI